MFPGNFRVPSCVLRQHDYFAPDLRQVTRAMRSAAASEVAKLDQAVPAHEEIIHLQIPEDFFHSVLCHSIPIQAFFCNKNKEAVGGGVLRVARRSGGGGGGAKAVVVYLPYQCEPVRHQQDACI